MTILCGSKFVAIIFSFIIHTEHSYFIGTRIHGLDLHENHKNWYHMKIKLFTVHSFGHAQLRILGSSRFRQELIIILDL